MIHEEEWTEIPDQIEDAIEDSLACDTDSSFSLSDASEEPAETQLDRGQILLHEMQCFFLILILLLSFLNLVLQY